MRAGEIRERIVIQQKALAESSSGGQIPTWTVFAERSAMVVAARGEEAFELAHTRADQVVKFVIRYLSGVTEQMRILHGGSGYSDGLTDTALEALGYRIHSIYSVRNVQQRNREMEIMATLKRK